MSLLTCPVEYMDSNIYSVTTTICECYAGSSFACNVWQQKQEVFDKLAHITRDLLTARAYAERIFSASGLVSTCKMNRMEKSLEMRSWMKVNTGPLRDIGFL